MPFPSKNTIYQVNSHGCLRSFRPAMQPPSFLHRKSCHPALQQLLTLPALSPAQLCQDSCVPPEGPYRVPVLQRGQHEAAIAQVLGQRLVVETFVVLLIPQGEGLGQHIHLSSNVGLQSVCLASLPPALTPLADGLQQLGTNKVPPLLRTAWHHLTLPPPWLRHSAG